MNTIKMKVAVKNSTDSILAALIVSIKTEMMAAYGEQLSALSTLKATAGDISNTKAVSEAISDLKELENAIHMISDALDKEFKPKHVIRAPTRLRCARTATTECLIRITVTATDVARNLFIRGVWSDAR